MAQFLSGLGSGATGGATSPSSALGVTPRATYGIMSAHVANTAYETVFLDDEFRLIGTISQAPGVASLSAYDNARVGATQSTNLAPTTATYPTTNTTPGWINSVNSCGEFGNDVVTLSERATASWGYTRWNASNGARANLAFVNSDHSDRTRVLQLDNGWLTSAPLWAPHPAGQTALFYRSDRKQRNLNALNSRLAGMIGSASYNATRRELVIMCDTTTANVFTMYIWKNFDLNANGVDVSLLPDTPTVTLTVDLTVPGTVVAPDTESAQKITPVLCDDGTVFLTSMWVNNYLRIYRVARNTGDTAVTITNPTSTALTTTYGRATNALLYGKRVMQSRNGNLVLSFTPYAYYGAGCMSFGVDRKNSGYTSINFADTNYGYQPVKFRDDGFAFYYAGNYYAANPQGAGIMGFMYAQAPGSGGAPLAMNQTIYLPAAPQPNTTNYPGISHVWEYNLQSPNPV
jgi:hypothetical protein